MYIYIYVYMLYLPRFVVLILFPGDWRHAPLYRHYLEAFFPLYLVAPKLYSVGVTIFDEAVISHVFFPVQDVGL